MTTRESGDQPPVAELPELFSKEWCIPAAEMWEAEVFPKLVDPDSWHYATEFKDTDTGSVCQFKCERGHITTWEPGKVLSDDECDFILWAPRENWRKVAEGKLDPVAAMASKRLLLRKGPMPVVIKEAEATKAVLRGHGLIPTAW